MRNSENYFTDNHNTFGGIIYESDFNTEYCGGNIASRIASDWRFDKVCKKNIEGRERRLNHRNMKGEQQSC